MISSFSLMERGSETWRDLEELTKVTYSFWEIRRRKWPLKPWIPYLLLQVCLSHNCDVISCVIFIFLDIDLQRHGLKLLNAGVDDKQWGTYPVDLLLWCCCCSECCSEFCLCSALQITPISKHHHNTWLPLELFLRYSFRHLIFLLYDQWPKSWNDLTGWLCKRKHP